MFGKAVHPNFHMSNVSAMLIKLFLSKLLKFTSESKLASKQYQSYTLLMSCLKIIKLVVSLFHGNLSVRCSVLPTRQSIAVLKGGNVK